MIHQAHGTKHTHNTKQTQTFHTQAHTKNTVCVFAKWCQTKKRLAAAAPTPPMPAQQKASIVMQHRRLQQQQQQLQQRHQQQHQRRSHHRPPPVQPPRNRLHLQPVHRHVSRRASVRVALPQCHFHHKPLRRPRKTVPLQRPPPLRPLPPPIRSTKPMSLRSQCPRRHPSLCRPSKSSRIRSRTSIRFDRLPKSTAFVRFDRHR